MIARFAAFFGDNALCRTCLKNLPDHSCPDPLVCLCPCRNADRSHFILNWLTDTAYTLLPQKRELIGLRHLLDSGSSVLELHIRTAIRRLQKVLPEEAKKATRVLKKRIRSVRKLWRRKWSRKCRRDPTCVARVLKRVKAVWAQERLQLKQLRKILRGPLVKRVRAAIDELKQVDVDVAAHATHILEYYEQQLNNLTARMTRCGENSGCRELVELKEMRVKEHLERLLRRVRRNIPHPLGNVTHLLRTVGLNQMADDAHRQYLEEGLKLEKIAASRMDCMTDACIEALDLQRQKLEEERDHRLVLLRTALENAQAAPVETEFPEKTLLIVLMVLLCLLVLGLLVVTIALGGYWFRKDKSTVRIHRQPSSEWEWREK